MVLNSGGKGVISTLEGEYLNKQIVKLKIPITIVHIWRRRNLIRFSELLWHSLKSQPKPSLTQLGRHSPSIPIKVYLHYIGAGLFILPFNHFHSFHSEKKEK